MTNLQPELHIVNTETDTTCWQRFADRRDLRLQTAIGVGPRCFDP